MEETQIGKKKTRTWVSRCSWGGHDFNTGMLYPQQ